jgi:hypothetical protein
MGHGWLERRYALLTALVLVALLACVIGTFAFLPTSGVRLSGLLPTASPRGAPALLRGNSRPSALGPAALLTAYVEHVLTPRVQQLEAALATANRQVLAYCQPPEMILVRCTDLSGRLGSGGNGTMTEALMAQALVLTGASHGLDTLLPPNMGQLPTLHLRCVIEDLALFADQLAGLLEESVAAVSSSTLQQASSGQPAPRVSYGPRVRSVVAILRRAEAWLETIDHETGAHVTLPGFGPGAPSLESQLAMQ